MSRFNDFNPNQIESGQRSNPRRIPRAGAIPRTGIEVGLDAAGLATTNVVIENGNRMAAQLDVALGSTAGAFYAAGRLADKQRDQATALAQHNNDVNAMYAKQEDDAYRGMAARQYRIDAETFAQKIKNREIVVPDGESVEDFATRFVSQRVADRPAAYAQVYADNMLPSVVGDLYKQQDEIKKQAVADYFTSQSERAIIATNSSEIRDALQSAKDFYPQATESQLLASIVLPAAKSAAENGDRVRLDAALEVMGNRFPDARIDLEQAFDRVTNQRKSKLSADFRDDVAKLYNDNAPLDMIDMRIEEWRGRVSEDAIQSEKIQLAGRKEAFRKEVVAKQTELFKQNIGGEIVRTYAPLFDSGEVTGGTAQLPKDGFKFVAPDGTKVEFSNEQVIDAIRADKWSQIDAQTSDPTQRMALRVDWLRKNPVAKDPAVVARMSGIAGRITAETTQQNIGPFALDAFQTYRSLGQMSEQVRDRHLVGDDLEFLRASNFLYENMTGISPADAMVFAAKTTRRDPSFAASITHTLKNEGEWFAKKLARVVGDADNATEASANIERRTRAYMMAFGRDAKASAEQAIKDFQSDNTKVGNFWVRTRGRDAIKNLNADAVSASIVGAYQKSNNAEQGQKLALGIDPNGNWRVVDTLNPAIPIPGSPVFSDNDLIRVDAFIRNRDSEVQRQKLIERQHENALGEAIKASRWYSSTLIESPGKPYGAELYGPVEPEANIRKRFGDAGTVKPEPVPDDPKLKSVLEYIDQQRKPRVSQAVPKTLKSTVGIRGDD